MSSALREVALVPPKAESVARADQKSLTHRLWSWPERRLGRCPPPGGPPPAWMLALLGQRGISGEGPVANFLAPSLAQLCDPAQLADIGPALSRLLLARARGERIWVYGDYDVDGVCATAILLRYFAAAGFVADFYIPHRQKEGYGLNAAAMAELAGRGGLLVTVDCGSTSHAELSAARAAGLDAIVIDHHQLADVLPPTVALLNPQRRDCGYAGGVLCAAGLAFMVVVALRRALRAEDLDHPGARYDVRKLLDLAAVATVADMVPLVGINRVLVHAGLARMRTAPCPGLAALCQVANTPPQQLDAAALGFRLAPRINARGRMAHAGQAVQLMLADAVEEALPLARSLDEANEARRALEKETVRAAQAQFAERGMHQDNVLVLHDPSWHAGVLGLVASRMSQQHFRPAVVIGEGGKGSARSVPGFHLVQALGHGASWLERFGGHPAAAGLTLKDGGADGLRAALHEAARAQLGDAPYVPTLQPELEVDLGALGDEACAALQRLGPFGHKNAEVLLAASALQVVHARCVGTDHLKLQLSAGPNAPPLDAIGFGLGHLLSGLPRALDVLFYLEQNVWQGRCRLQARIVDLRAAA